MSELRLTLPSPRRPWQQGIDGIWETAKDDDAVLRYEIDFARQLDPGENIETVSWAVDSGGVTVTDEGTMGTIASILIDSTGVIRGTITTDRGRTLIRRLRFVEADA